MGRPALRCDFRPRKVSSSGLHSRKSLINLSKTFIACLFSKHVSGTARISQNQAGKHGDDAKDRRWSAYHSKSERRANTKTGSCKFMYGASSGWGGEVIIEMDAEKLNAVGKVSNFGPK